LPKGKVKIVDEEMRKTQPKRCATALCPHALKLAGDFMDDIVPQMQGGAAHLQVYIAELGGDVVGFGFLDNGRIIKDISSIGMYVLEQYCRQGIAANILMQLKLVSAQKRPACQFWLLAL